MSTASEAFDQLPYEPLVPVHPFEVAISDHVWHELIILLSRSKLAPRTYEALQGRKYGVPYDWLVKARMIWLRDFDWPKHEAHLNTFNHYKTPVADDDGQDYDLHFVGLFSQKPDAIPLLCLHGWPGSFLEFLPIMSILRERYTPATLPYHIIVSSLPGYAFSSAPPLDRDFQLQDIARLMNKLMLQLGFEHGYAVQGGDIGSKVSRVLAATYDSCKAIHINFCIMPEPAHPDGKPDEIEEKGLERAAQFMRLESAYALLHATKPATIGYVLASSPLALLAWIGE